MTPGDDLTPDWTLLREADPSAHAQLEELAAAVFRAKSEVISPPNALAGALESARERGLVRDIAGEVSFAQLSARDQYVARHAFGSLDWSTSDALARNIAEVEHRTVSFRGQPSVGALVLRLLFASGHDVFGHVASLAKAQKETRHSFWNLYSVFCDVLPDLDVSPDVFLDGVLPAVEASMGDGAAGLLHGAVGRWAARSQQRCEALLELLERREQSTILAIPIVELAKFDRVKAHSEAVRLSGSTSIHMRGAALLALGNIPYHAGDPLLGRTILELTNVIDSRDTSLGPATAQAFGALAVAGSDRAREALETLSTWNDARTRLALAGVLFHSQESEAGNGWWRNILFNLAIASAADTATFQLLDYAAHHLAGQDPQATVHFLELAIKADRQDAPLDLSEALPMTMAELHRNAASLLESCITGWFATDYRALHEASARIAQERESAKLRYLELDLKQMYGQSDEQSVRLLRHVTGWVIGGAALSALLASALRLPALPRAVATFVQDALTTVALYNYPEGAGDYLRAALDRAILPAEARVIGAALRASDAYYEALRLLPQLPEFGPSAHRVYLRARQERERSALVMDEVRKRSVFLDLVKRVTLKYGRSAFHRYADSLSMPEPLASFSQSVELPRGEVLDPIGQLIQRIHLRHDLSPEQLSDETS